ncbi:MAG: hypothetical protein K8R23_19415 [Chthoniobacter sp.]|nr:hypothetical protein [Chthoniobacter sp.]
MYARVAFIFLLGVLFFSATLRAAVTLEQVAADERMWPKEVKLTQAVTLQLYDNGRESGSVQANVGMILQVRRVEVARVTVALGTALAVVPPGATDLLARAALAAPATAPAHGLQNFRADWKMPRGQWSVLSDGEIEQRDAKDTVSNAFKTIPQSGRMEYRLKLRYLAGKSACAMIYIMCSAGEKLERGNCYLIADAQNEKGQAEVSINRVINDGPRRMKAFPADASNGQWIDLRILYDGGSGLMEISRNGRVLGSWSDPEPLKTGKDFSVGTCLTKGGFKDVQVRPLP